ncbi:MAG: DJ-1/PfpI family protein [Planctomycetota bacterium]|nr:DJ-1/PfpI family protein [Planctomycetota bacterium]
MKRALVLLAKGAEEMETVIVVDVLRRAGVDVTLAGIAGAEPVECSRKVKLAPDCALADARGPFDLVALPGGGPGSQALAASAEVRKLLAEQERAGRFLAAICAAPIALVAAGVGKGKRLTSHPAVRDEVAAHGAYLEERVVQDGMLVTSRGPGTAFEFALKLVELLCGPETAREVAGPMILPK